MNHLLKVDLTKIKMKGQDDRIRLIGETNSRPGCGNII